MKRIIAAGLLVVLVAVLAGCGGKAKKGGPRGVTPASEMFDKKTVPNLNNQKGAGAG